MATKTSTKTPKIITTPLVVIDVIDKSVDEIYKIALEMNKQGYIVNKDAESFTSTAGKNIRWGFYNGSIFENGEFDYFDDGSTCERIFEESEVLTLYCYKMNPKEIKKIEGANIQLIGHLGPFAITLIDGYLCMDDNKIMNTKENVKVLKAMLKHLTA